MNEQYRDIEQCNTLEELVNNLRKTLGSCSINFLFGAGVNGKSFPQFSQFTKTIETMNDEGLTGKNIEEELSKCSDENKRQKILESFVDEYNSKDYDLQDDSLNNLSKMLTSIASIVSKAESRHPETKHINIFTLNYDRIVEEVLENSGLFRYTIAQDTSKGYTPYNIVGYDTLTRAFVPTFCVYKLHGSVNIEHKLQSENIVFPGQDKLGSVLSLFYETLFAMKGELLRQNSTLFVIGYSWSDSHVNGIIEDAIKAGLTVYWLQYSKEEKSPNIDKIITITPNEEKVDTTKSLTNLFNKAGQL